MKTSQDRRQMFAKLIREILSSMTPNCEGKRYSGQQVSYAKGRAWKQMRSVGF